MRFRCFVFYVLLVLLAPVVTAAGIVSELFRPGYRYEVERVGRGLIHAFCFGSSGVKLDRNLEFDGLSRIQLGSRVSIRSSVHLIAGSAGCIEIGCGSHVGRQSLLNGSGGGVFIGQGCAISAHVAIWSNTVVEIGKPTKSAPVVIGDRVLIGSGAVLLPGIVVGAGARIGAGAVVVDDVPEGAVVIGIPARVGLPRS